MVSMQYQCQCFLINGIEGTVIHFWDWFDRNEWALVYCVQSKHEMNDCLISYFHNLLFTVGYLVNKVGILVKC
jgi:hypothetical protein